MESEQLRPQGTSSKMAARMPRHGITNCRDSTTQTQSATSSGEASIEVGLVWRSAEAEDRSRPGSVCESALPGACSQQISIPPFLTLFRTRIWECAGTTFVAKDFQNRNLTSPTYDWCSCISLTEKKPGNRLLTH